MGGVGKRRVKRALEESLGAKQEKLKLVPALLGAYFNGQKTIVVANRPDFVWCRVRGSTSEVVQAFNETVANHYDLPILIYRDPNAPDIYKVYGRDIRQYDDWGGISFGLPPHGHSHSFGGGQGRDPVWIYKRQYLPMLPRPVSTGSMDLWIEPEFWYFGGRYHWWPGSGTTDLSSYKPTGSVNGRYVTVYIDGNSGIPQYLLGDEFNLVYTPRDPGDYIPLPNSAQGVPIAAVFLMTGTERIGWGEIYDLRQPEIPLPSTGSALQVYDTHVSEGQFGGIDFLELLNVEATGTTAYVNVAPPVSGSFVVFDEGVILGSALGLNVVGGIGEIVLSGSYAHLMLTGSAIGLPATGSVTIYDEGVLLGQADAINVVGDEVQAVLSGTTAHFMHTGVAGGGGGSGSVIIQDESLLLGSADTLNYLGAGVTVVMDGDTANITIPGISASGSASLRVGQAISLYDPTSAYWRVPDKGFVTGTLAIGVNGVWQIPIIDYTEQYPSSGTFQLDAAPPTGTVIGAIWGVHDPVLAGASTFLDLTDTPASYSGQSGSYPVVNSLEDALEFVPVDIGARVYNSSPITISNSTATELTFNSERWDTDGIHSVGANTERLTAKTKGKYVISGNIRWASDNDGSRIISIYLNGTTVIASERQDSVQGAITSQNVSTIYELDVDDYVELQVFHDAGGDLDITATANYSPEFAMQKIG